MNNKFKIIISNRNLYKEVELPIEATRYRVGTTIDCEFRLYKELFFEDFKLELINKDGNWSIMCSDNLYISMGDTRRLITKSLVHGDVLTIKYQESNNNVFDIEFLVNFDSKKINFDRKLNVKNVNIIKIGANNDNQIILHSEYVEGDSIQLVRRGNDFILEIKSVTYGVYHNGNRAEDGEVIKNGDFFSLSDFMFFYKDDVLWTEISKDCIIRNLKYEDCPEKNNYPMFVRNTRVKGLINDEAITILDPVAVPAKPELNILTSLMPAIVMLVLVVLLRGVMSSTGGSFVIFSACSMGLGVVTSIIGIHDKKKKYREDVKKRETTYLQYIDNKKEEIETARRKELQCLKEKYYSTEQDLVNIENFSSCLFDRTPDDEDFLDVYLGVGTRKAIKAIEYKQQEKLEIGDELSQIPNKLAEEYKYIEGAPIVISLKEANAVGVVGETDALYEMMKCMIVDIVSRQYYGDVKIYTLLGEDYNRYEWIRLLPHIQNIENCRNIVCDNESKNNIFEGIYKELTARSSVKSQRGFNIVFVMDDYGIKSHPISKFVKNASEINTVFIFFEKKEELLPLYCSNVIRLNNNNKGEVFKTENKSESSVFKFTSVDDKRIKNAVTILSPVFCEEISLESSLRKNISLFELLNIFGVDDLDLGARWGEAKIYDNIAVPLGVNVKDEVVYLDLHEKYHGPHGLVAGTTGSGKSEILQTYILGAATLFHPYEIGFVIIDFKGGGMVNQFKDLPHLIGAITNIDGKAIDRSLKSIKAELLKRQTLFAEIEVNHIDKYIKAYKEGTAKVALPHLVIIVDEFAELKAEQPEFMKELISAARIGRSLGVHLILATQKPAGQVNDQIWSNSKFKLCLKVQTQADSNEVLKSPLAAEIKEPGRAYLQVGNNEVFELLQSGYSGSPEKSESSSMKNYDISLLDFKGNRELVFRQKAEKSGSSRTQLESIVDYVKEYCISNRIELLPAICLPALADSIVCDMESYNYKKSLDIKNIIGVYDDPDHQYQGVAEVAYGSTNTLIIGSSQYGKTNLLELMIRTIAEIYSPTDVNMYVIDFGSMVLKTFEKLAHVGGVVCPSDDEKLKNLFKFLSDEITYRREKLLSIGVSSFASYREAGYDDIPQIIVFIDNMTALKELYLQDNDVLLGLCREGLSVGISFVIANAQTAGLGYKYLSNFATRIALFCNESSEYSSLFGTCRIKPDEKPGRCIVEVEKTLYECQTFLAFEGEREIERIQNMQKFIDKTNSIYPGIHAKPIPEIPDIMSEQYIFDNFSAAKEFGKQILGLSYDTVSPVVSDIIKNNMLAVSGAEEMGKSNFIRYFVHAMLQKDIATEVYVFDNYLKKLSSLRDAAENIVYEIGGAKCKDTLINLDVHLQNSYQELISGGNMPEEYKLLVINDEDTLTEISNDKDAISILKNIVGKYKMLNVFVIFGCVPNTQIAYGSPEAFKLVKESRNMLFFDNLDNCKLMDIPLSVIRNNKKKLAVGDAYYVNGNDCYKIKTPLAVK